MLPVGQSDSRGLLPMNRAQQALGFRTGEAHKGLAMKQSSGCSITSSRPLRGALVTLLGAILMSGAAIAAPPTYRIVVLPELPGATFSVAYGISEAGQIVGYAGPETLDSEYPVSWGMPPYAPQRLAELGPPYQATSATAVNDAGSMVGLAEVGLEHVAVMWDPSGAIVELGDLPRGQLLSWATDINA